MQILKWFWPWRPVIRETNTDAKEQSAIERTTSDCAAARPAPAEEGFAPTTSSIKSVETLSKQDARRELRAACERLRQEQAKSEELEQRISKLQVRLAEITRLAEERGNLIEKERKEAEEHRAQDLAYAEHQKKEALVTVKKKCDEDLQSFNVRVSALQMENDNLKRQLDEMSNRLEKANLRIEEYSVHLNNFGKFLENLPPDLKNTASK